ncbi:MAG: lasso peptide biosynthesis B2 protein [Wenzhouxiangella sp.]
MHRVLLKPARFFRHHPVFVQLWFLPVWLGLGVAKLAIFTVSFKRLVPRLGVSVGVRPWLPVITPAQERRARRVSRVVQLAARYTPWDSNCFPQAVVARVLLGLYRIPYCLFFGVRRKPGTGEFDAHAWIASGKVRVTGRYSFHQYAIVGVFAAPTLAQSLTDDRPPPKAPGTPINRNP